MDYTRQTNTITKRMLHKRYTLHKVCTTQLVTNLQFTHTFCNETQLRKPQKWHVIEKTKSSRLN